MNTRRIERYLIWGLIGAVITVTGEMAQGLAETIPATDRMLGLFETHAALPAWRIGFGSTVGAVGILLQYFGLYAIYLSFTNRDDKTAKLYQAGIFNYVFLGAIIHILMSVMIYVYKVNKDFLMEFAVWFAAPFLAVFLVGYVWFSILMFQRFRRKETIFPAWCCVLNPVIGKAAFNALSAVIPGTVLSNGVSYSNMGITAVVMFAVLLVVLKGYHQK